jgi:hypothetical protein
MRLASCVSLGRVSLGLLVFAALGVGGCFNYSEPVCSFSCGTGDAAADLCPGNYECRADGYCHKIGTTEACEFSDAAVSPDLSAIPDQGPDLASDGGPGDQGSEAPADQSLSD